MYFDAANPYHRHMMHYESDQQLSLPEIVAMGSVDAGTAAILWYLLEHRASVIVAGPTDPTPGVGKTTTLNSLLPFYPEGTGLVYTVGMYEDFGFLNDSPPHETTVLANEVSNHLRIYMWGRVASRFLKLPAQCYSVATTCHADTLRDVFNILTDDVRLPLADIQRIQVIVNIGLTGRSWPQRRRWLTTHFLAPLAPDADEHSGAAPAEVRQHIQFLPISTWKRNNDTFSTCPDETLTAIAQWAGVPVDQCVAAIERRSACLQELATLGADLETTMQAVQDLRLGEQLA